MSRSHHLQMNLLQILLYLVSITKFYWMSPSISNKFWFLRTSIRTLSLLRWQKHMSRSLLFRQLSFINLSLGLFRLSFIPLDSRIFKFMISFMNILLDLLCMHLCFFHVHLSYCFFFCLTFLQIKFSFLFFL